MYSNYVKYIPIIIRLFEENIFFKLCGVNTRLVDDMQIMKVRRFI